MMFDEILKTLAENGKSGLAYGKVSDLAAKAMKEDPEQATGYLLLRVLAERFIESTGRMAITSVQTENAYAYFAKQAHSLSDAYASGEVDAIKTTLDKVSLSSLEPFDPTLAASL